LKDVPDVGGSHDLAVSRCPSLAKYGKAVELGSRSEVAVISPTGLRPPQIKGKGVNSLFFVDQGAKVKFV
jgi:hypothetical protein